MAILHDLPTSVIAQVVEQLNPRLYIDFIRYLPPEVCLKILGYLDPVSLISVARSCRAWYELALDWKLWQQLYYMEGWKAREGEIDSWEQKVNETPVPNHPSFNQPQLGGAGAHVSKKRAISRDGDADVMMEDLASSARHEPVDTEMSGSSIFGDPALPGKPGTPRYMTSPKPGDKGKGKATSPDPAHFNEELFHKTMPSSGSPQAALWMWDGASRRFKLNWRYMYTLRRRLEKNWEEGRYTNFQLPHPDYPEEGHQECIYSLQFNDQYLVSGSRDKSLKIWDLETRRCLRTLSKHRGSVLCLQFDSDPEEDIVVSGSSDSDIIIWRFSTGEEIQTLRHAHKESVLNVKFDGRILVTCSKDKTIKIFNRKPLRHGELGYQEIDPVPTTLKNYGYALTYSPEDLPRTPPWTLIGVLEGHSAAVNAVQIHGREVVSASGDRHIKVWDWPTQTCTRTIVGHNKGIACVQYDGRRIVSGSSDNEVKVFDRATGLEVASLRSHTSLVRTVQAGFGDLPYSAEDDAAEAKRVDAEYFKARESGRLGEQDRPRAKGRRPGNAGSRRPEDICAYGAKLPPGGGGGKYGRIVSGSYDTTIIIWRRDKEGIWRDQHHLKQEEAAMAAYRRERSQRPPPDTGGIPLSLLPEYTVIGEASAGGYLNPLAAGDPFSNQDNRSPRGQASGAPPVAQTRVRLPGVSSLLQPPQMDPLAHPGFTPQAVQQYHQIIDRSVQLGQQALALALTNHPAILSQRAYVEAAIDRQPNPVTRSHLRQAFSAALIRAQFEQARQRREAIRGQEAALFASGTAPGTATAQGASQSGASSSSRSPSGSRQATQARTAEMAAAAAAHQAHAQLNAPSHRVHLHQVPDLSSSPQPAHPPAQDRPPVEQAPVEGHEMANPARVFKLQYDVRRIICCSQTSVIVGWDFCAEDPELREASRFFGHVQ